MFVIRRNVVYVGGLAENINEDIVHAAFIPFGILKSIQIPRDNSNSKHRGFAFVEFDLEEDAEQAIANMDGAELLGKVIRCNLAKAMPKLASGQAVWNSEEWIKQKLAADGESEGMQVEKSTDLTLVPTRHDDEDDNDVE